MNELVGQAVNPIEVDNIVDEELMLFTHDDAIEDRACMICEHFEVCAIVANVNKLYRNKQIKYMRENGLMVDGRIPRGHIFKTIEDEFSCSIYKEAIEQEDIGDAKEEHI